MGYSSCYLGNKRKPEIIREILDSEMRPFTILDYSVRGNVVYSLIQRTNQVFTKKDNIFSFVKIYTSPKQDIFQNAFDKYNFICVTLIRKEKGSYGEWFWKTMDESEHPYYYDCPEKLLKQSSVSSENGVIWRDLCRKYRKQQQEFKKIVSNIKVGSKIIFRNGIERKFEDVYNKSCTQIIATFIEEETQEVKRYRYPVTDIETIFEAESNVVAFQA